MKAIGKILKFAALSIAVLIVILCVGFYFFGERAIKIGIETAGTKSLGVGVYVKDVDLSVFKGNIAVTGVIVRNPADYAHENLLEINSLFIDTKISSLLSDTVHIKQIKLDGITVVIEQRGLSNNLQEVINSIPAPDKTESEPSGKKLYVEQLEVTNITVKAKLLPIPGKVDTITFHLPAIRMSDLGGDKELSPADLSGKIMVAITQEITRAGVDFLPDDLLNGMRSTLEGTFGIGKAFLKEGGKLIGTGKDVGAEVLDGLKSLIKPKKKEE